jgi:hypothetical protein
LRVVLAAPWGIHSAQPRIGRSSFVFGFLFERRGLWTSTAVSVYEELKSRGHDVSKIAPHSIASCATGVIVDPATATRIAGADPRRDCDAMAD